MSDRGHLSALAEHVCEFTIWSHTSYGKDDIAEVYLCSHRDCPAWDYGPRRPYREDDSAPEEVESDG